MLQPFPEYQPLKVWGGGEKNVAPQADGVGALDLSFLTCTAQWMLSAEDISAGVFMDVSPMNFIEWILIALSTKHLCVI